jgi:hypothetical protein
MPVEANRDVIIGQDHRTALGQQIRLPIGIPIHEETLACYGVCVCDRPTGNHDACIVGVDNLRLIGWDEADGDLEKDKYNEKRQRNESDAALAMAAHDIFSHSGTMTELTEHMRP